MPEDRLNVTISKCQNFDRSPQWAFISHSIMSEMSFSTIWLLFFEKWFLQAVSTSYNLHARFMKHLQQKKISEIRSILALWVSRSLVGWCKMRSLCTWRRNCEHTIAHSGCFVRLYCIIEPQSVLLNTPNTPGKECKIFSQAQHPIHVLISRLYSDHPKQPYTHDTSHFGNLLFASVLRIWTLWLSPTVWMVVLERCHNS